MCGPPDLIRREDFPRLPQYLPRPLPPQDDQLLRDELRRTDDLPANALLLTRATGIRIGECIDLALDCLRQIGPKNEERLAGHVAHPYPSIEQPQYRVEYRVEFF